VGNIDISTTNVAATATVLSERGYDYASRMITALRAALDAAEANINLKADWIDATINDMAQGEQDAAEARAVGVKPLVWRKDGSAQAAKTRIGEYRVAKIDGEWMWFFAWLPKSNEDRIDKGRVKPNTEDAAKVAAQADYTAAILSALHPASPLGAVVMREKAAQFCTDNEVGVSPNRGYVIGPFEQGEHSGTHPGMAYSPAIRAIPLAFTPAELLAAAAELPEVRALVDAGELMEKWAKWVNEPISTPFPAHLTGCVSGFRAALAPFARKGE